MEAVVIARLPEGGERFEGEEAPELLELPPDEAVVAVGPVQYELEVAPVAGDELLVRGKVWCEATLRCARCAEPFTVKVAEDPYVRAYEVHDETESVDLTPDIREATLLAFPANPVCRPECAGLCATCGKNLNDGPCECRPADDARWGGLDGLKL